MKIQSFSLQPCMFVPLLTAHASANQSILLPLIAPGTPQGIEGGLWRADLSAHSSPRQGCSKWDLLSTVSS